MKKMKKAATTFDTLDNSQMKQVFGGGRWVVIRDPDGNETTVWVP